jgi:hypothetical protein
LSLIGLRASLGTGAVLGPMWPLVPRGLW